MATSKGTESQFMATGKNYFADEIGTLRLKQQPQTVVGAGDVGYLITGIKEAKEVKVGDTITQSENPTPFAISGFEEVKPMVFAGIYPVDTEEYEELRASMEKLQLNDASLVFQPESSAALGFGFDVALGMLHLEIIQERLERGYECYHNRSQCVLSCLHQKRSRYYFTCKQPFRPTSPSYLDRVEEPFIKATIITKSDYVGNDVSLHRKTGNHHKPNLPHN